MFLLATEAIGMRICDSGFSGAVGRRTSYQGFEGDLELTDSIYPGLIFSERDQSNIIACLSHSKISYRLRCNLVLGV